MTQAIAPISPYYGSLPEDNWGVSDYFSAKNLPNESPPYVLRAESYFQQVEINPAALEGASLRPDVSAIPRMNYISKGTYLYKTRDIDIEKKKNDIRNKILGYAGLLDDCDGYGGHAPYAKDILNAILFIPHIPDAGIETVRVMAAGDGDVMFDWKKPEHYLEIGFIDGEISFFGDMPNGGERLDGDEIYDKESIPENLQRLISAIFPPR